MWNSDLHHRQWYWSSAKSLTSESSRHWYSLPYQRSDSFRRIQVLIHNLDTTLKQVFSLSIPPKGAWTKLGVLPLSLWNSCVGDAGICQTSNLEPQTDNALLAELPRLVKCVYSNFDLIKDNIPYYIINVINICQYQLNPLNCLTQLFN